jgi:hypothetical protein
VNLSGMTDGTITSVLALNEDTGGNTFTPVAGNSVTLQQLDHWTHSLGGNWATASNWKLGLPTATIDADVDASGTYAVNINSGDVAYALLLNAARSSVTDNAGTLTLAGPGGSASPNGALNINAGTFVLNGGGIKAGSVAIASGARLSIQQSYTGTRALGETILNNGLLVIGDAYGTVTVSGSISGSGAINIHNRATIFNGAITGSENFTVANTAKAVISQAVTGSGSFNLVNSGNLEFGSSDTEKVTFASGASGKLKLDHSLTAPFTGQLAGLTAKNAVDLADLTWVPGKMSASFSDTKSTLSVTNGTSTVALSLSGNYSNASWVLSKDTTGGTRVVDPHVVGSLTPNSSGGADGRIDLSDISFGVDTTLGYSANSGNTGGTLTVSDDFHAQSVALLGHHYTESAFAMTSDGHGGTFITDPTPNQHQFLSQPHATMGTFLT